MAYVGELERAFACPFKVWHGNVADEFSKHLLTQTETDAFWYSSVNVSSVCAKIFFSNYYAEFNEVDEMKFKVVHINLRACLMPVFNAKHIFASMFD